MVTNQIKCTNCGSERLLFWAKTNKFQCRLCDNLFSFKKKSKRTKYGSKKTNGYDSKKESRRAASLWLLSKSGKITDLREQVTFELAPAQYVFNHIGKPVCVRRAMKYIADFVYISDRGETIVEDCKGFRTQEYKQKRNLMKRLFGIVIFES